MSRAERWPWPPAIPAKAATEFAAKPSRSCANLPKLFYEALRVGRNYSLWLKVSFLATFRSEVFRIWTYGFPERFAAFGAGGITGNFWECLACELGILHERHLFVGWQQKWDPKRARGNVIMDAGIISGSFQPALEIR